MVSQLNSLANLWVWVLAEFLTMCFLAIYLLKIGARPYKFLNEGHKTFSKWYLSEVHLWEKMLLILMACTVISVAAYNLVIILFSAPHNWDSMNYHLPRMAYYLQQGNFFFFDGNYWAQVIHPKNSTALLIYVFLVSGHNENITQFVQYASYWVFVLSIWGISRKIGFNQAESIFSGLVGGLITEAILQSTTTQNDLAIAAYLGVTIYCFFAFKNNSSASYLIVAGLGLGLALGSKSSTLMALPSLALIVLYVFKPNAKYPASKPVIAFAFLIPLVFLSLPAGYIENYQKFSHPIGPLEIRQIHSFEGGSTSEILKGGYYNLLRYSMNFISFDGLPPTQLILSVQKAVRFLPLKFISLLGVDLESTSGIVFGPFTYDRKPTINEEYAFWGVLGFGLIWISIFISLFSLDKNKINSLLSFSTLTFLLIQSFAGPYDWSRGRYFLIPALLGIPLVGSWITVKNKIVRIYLLFIILLGCVSAISAVIYKTNYQSSNYSSIPNDNLLVVNRSRQLFYNNPRYYKPFTSFDYLVPKDAIVAVYLLRTYEYPLFGEYLTRTIIPINSFTQGMLPVPENAEYLLYDEGYPCPMDTDKYLGVDWFLRKLNDTNRKCDPAVSSEGS